MITNYMDIKEFIESKLEGVFQGSEPNQWSSKTV